MDSRPPSAPVTEPPASSPVVEIGGFEVLTRLGEGGMGQVFKARQKSVDRTVALKVLTPKLAQDADYVHRFEREAKAAGALSHPNIVGVIDRGEQLNGPAPLRWIAFEFVDGASLESRIKQGRLSEREALKVVRDIGDALRYASDKGLIHRDVKPDNILLTSDGTPKLADLGLAKFEKDDTSLTQTGVVMGTPHYMAPEQALGERDLDVRADIYALGLVFYRCLTAEMPFVADSALAILTRHINQDCPDPRAVVPEISEGSAQLLRGMTARNKTLRFRPDEVTEKANALLAKLSAGGSQRMLGLTPSSAQPRAVPATAPAARAPSTRGQATSGARPPQTAVAVANGAKPSAAKIAAAKTAPAKTAAPEPERAERNVALVLAFAACAVLAAGITLVVKARPKTVPVDEGPSAVASSATGAGVQTPVVNVPTPTVDAEVPKDRTSELAAKVRQASAQAAENPADARALLEGLARETPGAAEDLGVAIDAIKAVEALADSARAGDLAKADAARGDLATLSKTGPKPSRLEHAARREALAWHDVAEKLIAMHAYVRGSADAPNPKREIVADTGARDALAEVWTKVVQGELEPAVRAFDRAEWRVAKEHAEAAQRALRGPLLIRLADAALTVAELATLLDGSKTLTPLDAVPRLGATAKASDFVRRFVAVDCTAEKLTLPDFLLKGCWDRTSGGLALHAIQAVKKVGERRPDDYLGLGDRLLQLRMTVSIDRGGLTMVLVKHGALMPREVNWNVALLGANGKHRVFTKNGPKLDQSDIEGPFTAVKHDGAARTAVQDFIWRPTERTGDAGWDLEIQLDGKSIATWPVRKFGQLAEVPLVRGASATVRDVEWVVRR